MSETMFSRRLALTALMGASLGACLPIEYLPAPDLGGGPGLGSPLLSGTYGGEWRDGTFLLETVVYGEGSIRMTRLAGGVGQGNSSLFSPIGGGRYRNDTGSTITITSQESFNWVNVNGGNFVAYRRMT